MLNDSERVDPIYSGKKGNMGDISMGFEVACL